MFPITVIFQQEGQPDSKHEIGALAAYRLGRVVQDGGGRFANIGDYIMQNAAGTLLTPALANRYPGGEASALIAQRDAAAAALDAIEKGASKIEHVRPAEELEAEAPIEPEGPVEEVISADGLGK